MFIVNQALTQVTALHEKKNDINSYFVPWDITFLDPVLGRKPSTETALSSRDSNEFEGARVSSI